MTVAAVAVGGTWGREQLGSTGRWEQAGGDQSREAAGWDEAVAREVEGHTAHLCGVNNGTVNATKLKLEINTLLEIIKRK